MAGKEIRILLVEDNPTEVLLLQETFSDITGADFKITQVERLQDALSCLEKEPSDIVLLDLGLPDSQGIDTFIQLHRHSPDIPVLVLTALDDEAVGMKAVQQGAQDYLVKKQVQAPLLGRSIRYAIERHQLQSELAATKQREQQEREFHSMERLSESPPASITAQIYSFGSLRENAPEEFEKAVAAYEHLLDSAFEQRVFKTNDVTSDNLRILADQLGFLRAGPRDVIEIHSTALKRKVTDAPLLKTQAYMEEGRITVLELMGNLATHYRLYYPKSKVK
jgi:DNA-binding response OmpR family regulator